METAKSRELAERKQASLYNLKFEMYPKFDVWQFMTDFRTS